jgi:hypothetical protein
MTRDNKPESSIEERIDYAYWKLPGGSSTVTYSLPVFHEIDFAVNEGYRKIPHGGIEESGLLFGRIEAKGTSIEAFRPIQCEHASGPSLLFSDQDLVLLTQQITDAATDPELAGLAPVGWFLGHTRGPLVLTDRESELFDHYFPQTGMLTLLVKPERFQPTRFGFLVRGQDGSVPHDALQNAVILPLPGKNAKAASGPIASIPAPALNSIPTRRHVEGEDRQQAIRQEPTSARVAPNKEMAASPANPVETRVTRRQRRLNVEQVRPRSDEYQEHDGTEETDGSHSAPASAASEDLEPIRMASLARSSSQSGLTYSQPLAHLEETPLDELQQFELLKKKKPASTAARLVMVLPLAALFGCVVGYIAYLQVPSPLIQLSVQGRGQTVIVTWPADQTRSAVYAAVRVDDSTPVMLTPEERVAGRVEVTASADMKVELIARNWIHDSRGIVRFVKPLANTAP